MTEPTTVTRLPIPQGYQLAVAIDQGGQQSAVVLGYVAPAMPTTEQAQAEFNRVWAMLRTAMSNGSQATGAILRDVSGAEGNAIELAAPINPVGAAVGFPGVAAASTLIRWGSTNGSRSGKGRTFVPALPAGSVADNGRNVRPEHVTSVQGAIDAYLGGTAVDSPMFLAVLSFKRGAAYPITSGAVAAIAGIQRRRMR